jgi:hypothetical protein
LGFRRRGVSNGSNINEVLRPLNILGSDIWERSLADGLFDGLLYWFLAEAAKHRRREERWRRTRKKERINKKDFTVWRRIMSERANLWSKSANRKRQIPDFFSCTLHNTAFLSPSHTRARETGQVKKTNKSERESGTTPTPQPTSTPSGHPKNCHR